MGLEMKIEKVSDFEHIYMVEVFADEFSNLFDSSDSKRYKSWLYRTLKNYEEGNLKRNVHYEPIKGYNNLYAFRYPHSKLNPRVIYAYINGHNNLILLTAFLERKKSDYTIGIERAEQRKKKIF